MRLAEMVLRMNMDTYCTKCVRWVEELFHALFSGIGNYLLVSTAVLAECRQMEAELAVFPPGLLQLLSPALTEEFGKLICNYDALALELQDALCDLRRHLHVCSSVFRSALSPFIHKFDTDIASDKFGQFMIVQNLDRVPNLLEFSIRPVYEDHSTLLAGLIHHLKNLQIFTYRSYCTDEIIEQLRLHCPLLTEVDVAGSGAVTSFSVHNLQELRTVKILNLEGTRIEDEEYAAIISSLPNVTNMTFWLDEDLILRHIAEQRLDRITHVNCFFLDINTLPQRCPNTTNIILSSNMRDLSGITAFSVLRSLELYDLHYGRCNLNSVITAIGHRLTDLKLTQVSGVNQQVIVTLCPSLVNFSLVWCSFLHIHTNPPFDPGLPHFRNVTSLKIDNSFAHPIDCRFVLHYSSLQTLDLRSVSIFTPDFVKEIVKLDAFAQLKVLHVEERLAGVLTMDSLQLLIQHCPLLERIEGLKKCPHFNSLLIEQFKRHIISQNFDLEIKD
jgi:hypothetical protein